ncbi:uncharacterized protein RSE6_01086 [Rhynchosporium secalis]|uniref:Uncharacterized protein n=1 Tax=Rhynchosporium secalis TaxID=38038 RepID=A0A1E1LWW7_RHYSE|nr:uncharacterized protein RSE6_01086 [Rhynchosporium secalis]
MDTSSSETPVPQLTLFRTRPRADMKSLLGAHYQEVIPDQRIDPLPPGIESDYTRERLLKSLSYADALLRTKHRKLSPIGGRALMLYKDASLALIRTHEEAVRFRAFLNLVRPLNNATLYESIIALQKTAFYARYGDVFAQVCGSIRAEAEARKIHGWEALVKSYWTEIQAKITAERDIWKKAMCGEEELDGRCPIHIAISEVCTAGGFNFAETLTIVHHYAIRNEVVHSNFEEMIRKGHFNDLSAQLHRELYDIPKVIAFSEGLQAKLMTKIVRAMTAKWFIIDTELEDTVQTWVPSAALLEYHKKLKAGTLGGEGYKKMMGDIARQVVKNAREEKKQKELLEGVESNWGLSEGAISAKKKRAASASFKAEVQEMKKRRKLYDGLMNMADGLKTRANAYVEEYGSLEPPPTVVKDTLLDSSEEWTETMQKDNKACSVFSSLTHNELFASTIRTKR